MSIKNDTQYETVYVDEVKKEQDSYCLHRTDGWSFQVTDPGFEPPAGEYKFYGKGTGYVVRGVVHESGKVLFYKTPEEQAEIAQKQHEEYERERALIEKQPVVEFAGRTYTKDMGEISGFGGGYEETCRKMVLSGAKWIDDNPKADPQFSGYKGIYGIIKEDNDDAKALSEAITDKEVTGEYGCTGAIHQACISHVMAVKRLGWDYYCAEMRKHDPESQ